MSARIPARRVGQCALAPLRPSSTYWISAPTSTLSLTARRHLTSPLTRLGQRLLPKKPELDLSNPVLQDLIKKREEEKSRKGEKLKRPDLDQGKFAEDTTIFKPDYEIPGFRDSLSEAEQQQLREANTSRRRALDRKKDVQLSSAKLDPDPRGRQLWERRMVIRSLRRRGRLTKDQQLARTERQSLFRSQNLPTSVKKLTKIMNQIQGKTVEEAFVQLRFSKKRAARDVLKGLQIARDEAVVARGMGLGRVVTEKEELPRKAGTEVAKADETKEEKRDEDVEEEERPSAKEVAQEARLLPNGTWRKYKSRNAVTIELKDGSRKQVHDPTEIYIDQAWVGKGEQWKSPEYRARGRVNLLTHRTTSFSVVLKEEKTRMRISEEIQKKRADRKIWTPLPDRPITSQRQYCLW